MIQRINCMIDPEVRAFLIKKNKNCLVLDLSKSGGGCCPTYDVADITYKKPDNLELYNTSDFEGITIYISVKAKVLTPVLRFSLENNGLMKQIVPKGLYLKR